MVEICEKTKYWNKYHVLYVKSASAFLFFSQSIVNTDRIYSKKMKLPQN